MANLHRARQARSPASRVLFGVTCAAALVVGPLSLLEPPAQATGAATWSVDSAPALNGLEGLNTISCPDTSYCVALESNQDEDDALIWSGGTWSAVPLVEPGGPLQLNGVSSASESLCFAVGEESGAGPGPGDDAAGVIEKWNGSAWSTEPNPQTSDGSVSFAGVSCPSTTSCVAVGMDGTDGGFADIWSGGSWTQAYTEQDLNPSGVSCSTPTSCVTVGGGAVGTNTLASVLLAGGTWTPESVPDPGADGSLTGVSCASPTFCMAVGSVEVGNVGWNSGLTENWDGESWQVVPSPNYPEDDLGPGFIGGGILLGVSCVSAQACVADGYSGGGVNSEGLGYPGLAVVETWDGTAWSLTPTPAPVEPVGAAARVQLFGVSCVPDAGDAQCVVVGLQTPDNSNISAFVERTSAAVGSLEATSTQVQSEGQGDVSATVTIGATSEAVRALALGAAGSTPTGSVTFLKNGLPMTNCPPVALNAGQASCSPDPGASGPITAVYSGDSTFDGSSNQQVGTLPVTYAANGATSGTAPVDTASPYSSFATVSVLGPGTLAKTGDTFAGWNTMANGSGTSYAPGATLTILAATGVFAVWTTTRATTDDDDDDRATSDNDDDDRATSDNDDDDRATSDDDDDDRATSDETTTTAAPTQSSTAPALHASTSQVDFGATTLGTYDGPLSVTLTNTGSIGDRVNGYELSGDNDFVFDNTKSQCASTLAPGASCVLHFDFLPGGVGTRTEYVSVLDADSSGITIALTGVGSIGYYQVTSQGAVGHAGDAAYYGQVTTTLNKPIVGIAPTGDDGGYWLVGADGGVFSFGDAHFYGSTGGLRLNKPIVGMTADGSGGYWFVASDGGIFSYGSAQFYGSTGAMRLNKPIVGMAATTDGGGYWLVASDGGIFSYGDARFFGSTGDLALNKSIVGMVPTPDDGGYWLVASDGGVFSYGDARYFGSTGGTKLAQPIVGIAAMPDGGGYWFSAADGGLFNYGSAPFYGNDVGSGSGSVVGMASDGLATFQAQANQAAVRHFRPKEAPAGVPAGTPRFAGPSTSGG